MRFRVNRNLPLILAVILFGALFLTALFMMIRSWDMERRRVNLPELDRDSITYQGVTYTQRKDLDTVLVMGLDKYETDQVSGKYLNYQQSDFMLLIAVDRKTESYSVLHLNRDTMTDMSVLGDQGKRVDKVYGQLALAHTYGTGGNDSCRNAVEAVTNLLHGVKIDHFLSMTMDAVSILNDEAGGVTVEILDDFSQVDPDLVQGSTMTLKGKQALTYVRTRKDMEDSSNLHRMERQRQYLTALQQKLNSCSQADENFYARVLKKISQYLTSDVTVNQMTILLEQMGGYTFKGFHTLEGEAVKGEKFMEFYPDQDALMKTVLELYFKPKE